MSFHTFDPDRAERLEDPDRYAYLSVDELLALLEPAAADLVADLGSGTGFYTDDVAAAVDRVLAVDVQPEMHRLYREKGLPPNVDPVTATVDALPFRSASLDAAVSTMTFHEFATPDALSEVARVLVSGGRLGIGDWTATGTGEEGPPLAERFDAAEATQRLESAGFVVERAQDRRETFVITAVAP